jgi:ATP-binding cassette subfamily A (ABC1) protein 3
MCPSTFYLWLVSNLPGSAYARNLFIPPSHFGIGDPTPVRSLTDALHAAGAGRNTLVFVNNGYTGGDIEKVINLVAKPARDSGRNIEIISSPDQLDIICRNTLRGTSNCIGAAEFFSSPSEGPQGKWNYSIRADGALGSKIVTTSISNDAEIYVLPLQHAVDFAIARNNATIDQSVLDSADKVEECPFTSLTAQQRKDMIRVRYMGGIIDILAVAFFIGMVGTTYQLTGLMASEREIGMSQLLDCMMPNRRHWHAQAARLISHHLAFTFLYAPGWIVIAIILKVGVFAKTSIGVLIVFHILAGLSLCSLALFGAAFFKKAQLSGISAVIICLLLAVLAQVIGKASTGAVAILGLIFPPMTYTWFIILLARWERQDVAAQMTHRAPENPWAINGITLWVFLIIQIFAYPALAAQVERILYGTASKSRTVTDQPNNPIALSIDGFSKEYRPNWFARKIAPLFGKRKQSVLAVNGLKFDVHKGQIAVLLGANGSGKSTTLDAVAGLTKITSGTIHLDGHGGFGLCPQKVISSFSFVWLLED